MGRPRNDAEGPNAKKRMEQAFWVALEEKPFDKITVADIAKLAGVNRNSFYYHFANMMDLARYAVKDCPTILFHLPLPPLKAGERPNFKLAHEPQYKTLYSQARLLAGPHSTHELSKMLKDTVLSNWLNEFDLAYDDLSETDLFSITFAAGGMFQVVASEFLADKEHPLESLWSSPLIMGAIDNVLRLFEEASARKRGAATTR